MNYRLELPIKLPSLNDYINMNRYNKYSGARLKSDYEKDIQVFVKQQLKNISITKPVKIYFTWIEKDKRRDLDNIYSSKKFILDALVKSDVIRDDGQKYVIALRDNVEIGKDYKVIVDIEEIN